MYIYCASSACAFMSIVLAGQIWFCGYAGVPGSAELEGQSEWSLTGFLRRWLPEGILSMTSRHTRAKPGRVSAAIFRVRIWLAASESKKASGTAELI